MQSFHKTTFSFLQLQTKNILWAKSTALPTTMLSCAFYPIADIRFFCGVTLRICYRIWTQYFPYFPHIDKWTVSFHSSSIDSLENLLSRSAKCLIICRWQSASIKETEEWTECTATRKRKSSGKSTEIFNWAPSNSQCQGKPVDNSLKKNWTR